MLAPLATVSVIAAAWLIYWLVASAAIKQAYGGGERRLAADGVSLSCDEAEWGGFPFRVEQSCRAPKVTIDEPGRRFDISAAKILWVVQAYDPRHAVLLLDGPTMIRGLGLGEIHHDRALASFRSSADETWQASIEFPKIAVEQWGEAGRLLMHARASGNGNVDLALAADKLNVTLAGGAALPIDSLEIETTLPQTAIRENVARFLSRKGGTIAVTNVSAQQGELVVRGSGTVGIDGEGYLTGQIATRISRVDLLFEIVKRFARISNGDAAAAKAIIGLLNKGNSGNAALDLIAKDHKLYWGPFKLAELRPLF